MAKDLWWKHSKYCSRMNYSIIVSTMTPLFAIVSIFLNLLLLLLIYFKSGKEMKFYKNILLFQTVLCILYAVTHGVASPYWLSTTGTFIFYPSGYFEKTTVGVWALLLYSGCYIEINIMLATSFLCTYVQLCRPFLAKVTHSWRVIVCTLSVHSLIVLACLLIINHFLSGSNRLFEAVHNEILQYQLPISVNCFLGIRFDATSKDVGFMLQLPIGMGSIIVILFACFGVMTFCGFKIAANLRQNLINKRSKEIHKTVFGMLIVQTVSPLILCQIPAAFNITAAMSVFEEGDFFPFVLAFLMCLYPIVHVIVTTFFLKDYRDIVLCRRPLFEPSTSTGRQTTRNSTEQMKIYARRSLPNYR